MGSEAYLCVSPFQGAFPSRQWDDFEGDSDILAIDDEATPLLWLALFRPADLRVAKIDRDLEDWTVGTRPITVPVAPRQRAFSQLYAAVDALEPILGESIADHGELMREALRWMPGMYVTIEWSIDGEPVWDVDISAALAVLDGEIPDVDQAREILRDTCALRLDRPLPSARLVLDRVNADEDDRWNFQRLLGRSHCQMVPWEVPI
jgi:hypothetical protein